MAQLYPCCAPGARQRPRTVRLTHGCADTADTADTAAPAPAGHIDLRSSEFYTLHLGSGTSLSEALQVVNTSRPGGADAGHAPSRVHCG